MLCKHGSCGRGAMAQKNRQLKHYGKPSPKRKRENNTRQRVDKLVNVLLNFYTRKTTMRVIRQTTTQRIRKTTITGGGLPNTMARIPLRLFVTKEPTGTHQRLRYRKGRVTLGGTPDAPLKCAFPFATRAFLSPLPTPKFPFFFGTVSRLYSLLNIHRVIAPLGGLTYGKQKDCPIALPLVRPLGYLIRTHSRGTPTPPPQTTPQTITQKFKNARSFARLLVRSQTRHTEALCQN